MGGGYGGGVLRFKLVFLILGLLTDPMSFDADHGYVHNDEGQYVCENANVNLSRPSYVEAWGSL